MQRDMPNTIPKKMPKALPKHTKKMVVCVWLLEIVVWANVGPEIDVGSAKSGLDVEKMVVFEVPNRFGDWCNRV